MITNMAQVVEALLFVGVAGGLLWFVWRVIVRRMYRAWHIRRIEEDRLMREAAGRSAGPDQKR